LNTSQNDLRQRCCHAHNARDPFVGVPSLRQYIKSPADGKDRIPRRSFFLHMAVYPCAGSDEVPVSRGKEQNSLSVSLGGEKSGRKTHVPNPQEAPEGWNRLHIALLAGMGSSAISLQDNRPSIHSEVGQLLSHTEVIEIAPYKSASTQSCSCGQVVGRAPVLATWVIRSDNRLF
jgi:hypothetical protein